MAPSSAVSLPTQARSDLPLLRLDAGSWCRHRRESVRPEHPELEDRHVGDREQVGTEKLSRRLSMITPSRGVSNSADCRTRTYAPCTWSSTSIASRVCPGSSERSSTARSSDQEQLTSVGFSGVGRPTMAIRTALRLARLPSTGEIGERGLHQIAHPSPCSAEIVICTGHPAPFREIRASRNLRIHALLALLTATNTRRPSRRSSSPIALSCA